MKHGPSFFVFKDRLLLLKVMACQTSYRRSSWLTVLPVTTFNTAAGNVDMDITKWA